MLIEYPDGFLINWQFENHALHIILISLLNNALTPFPVLAESRLMCFLGLYIELFTFL